MRNLFTNKPSIKGENKKGIGLILMLLLAPAILFASHFRYGNISWQNTSGNVVSYKISASFRGNSFGALPAVGATVNLGSDGIFNFGDGTTAQIILTITSVNPTENFFFWRVFNY